MRALIDNPCRPSPRVHRTVRGLALFEAREPFVCTLGESRRTLDRRYAAHYAPHMEPETRGSIRELPPADRRGSFRASSYRGLRLRPRPFFQGFTWCAFIIALVIGPQVGAEASGALDLDAQKAIGPLGLDLSPAPNSICDESESYYSAGVGTTTFYTEIFGVTTTWRNIVSNGPSLWSNSVSIVNMNHGTTPSTRRATMVESSATWWGLYTAWGTRANRSYLIQVNRTEILRDGGQSNLGNYARSTAVHEFGHALSLRDNPNTQYVSIMKYSDMAAGINPWPYDISCVHEIY